VANHLTAVPEADAGHQWFSIATPSMIVAGLVLPVGV
jgi:hypothetical protein